MNAAPPKGPYHGPDTCENEEKACGLCANCTIPQPDPWAGYAAHTQYLSSGIKVDQPRADAIAEDRALSAIAPGPRSRADAIAKRDAERLAAAIEVIALEDRDRAIAGDYRADTYKEHAERILAALAPADPTADLRADAGYLADAASHMADHMDQEGLYCEDKANVRHFAAKVRAALAAESPERPA